jgi:AcrR family transcriptional regulator
MEQRERILDAVAELTTARGRLPSLLEVAAEVGLTKQGVLHYFPSREALDTAVLLRSLARIDAAMAEAAATGSPVATYLGLSSPDDGDYAAAAVVLSAASAGMPVQVQDATARWEALIADEVGDPVRAEVVRLTGDGLFAEALLTGVAPATDRIERLVAHLRGPLRGQPS